jgi:hypothetical protein
MLSISNENLQFIAVSVLSLLNFALLAWQAFKRVPREVEKMRAEKMDLLSDAAESNMQGAQISNDLLMQRIIEQKKELRDRVNHIAQLQKQLIDNGIQPVPYLPSESDPRIQVIGKGI